MSNPLTESPATVSEISDRASQVRSFKEESAAYLGRIRHGQMDSLPAIIGFILLVILFSFLSPVFLTSLNFANLLQQAAPLIVLAMGLVFVLLIAEIDLSAGVTSGLVSAVFVVAMTNYGISWWLAVIISLASGVGIGLGIGLLVAKVGIPSFVVTLAAFLAFQGLQLMVIGEGGLYRIQSPRILEIENGNLPVAVGWALAVATILLILGGGLMARRRRMLNGHPNRSISVLFVRTGVIAIGVIASVYFLSLERSSNPLFPIRGVPIVVLIVVGILVVGTYTLSRTQFGVHVYAVGGNPEGARRAGIRVGRLRTLIFMIGSGLAAISGLLSASRIGAVDASAGRTIVLNGVAAAVVGGVSLFGGRGRLSDAIVGGLVIAVIENGLGLLNLPSGLNLAVTGAVLLIAATADALSRKHGTLGVH